MSEMNPEYPRVTVYTSLNSLGYDVQVWFHPYEGKCLQLTSNRFSTREEGHGWADRWLDASEFANIRRIHKV